MKAWIRNNLPHAHTQQGHEAVVVLKAWNAALAHPKEVAPAADEIMKVVDEEVSHEPDRWRVRARIKTLFP